jgi:hypothetical protein
VGEARAAAQRLRIPGVKWHVADFFDFQGEAPFDVVLSVASAHYAALEGRGDDLFRQFREWTKLGGLLVLLAPRRKPEVPFVEVLESPEWHPLFSYDELRAICERNGFVVERLVPTVGRLGALAKQVDWAISRRWPRLSQALRPVPLLLQAGAGVTFPNREIPSVFWSLVARRV